MAPLHISVLKFTYLPQTCKSPYFGFWQASVPMTGLNEYLIDFTTVEFTMAGLKLTRTYHNQLEPDGVN